MLTKHGRLVLDLAPSPENPRNGEGAFLELADGRIMFVYSSFRASFADDAESHLVARYSSDRGETWSEGYVIASPGEYNAMNLMSVSLLRMQNRDVGLFAILRMDHHDARLFLFRSSDEGKTWSEPRPIVPGAGYYVTNNDRVVRLSTGRIVVPTALARSRDEAKHGLQALDVRCTVFVFLSDDDGQTWREARSSCAFSNPHSRSGLQEPGIVELSNGSLWMYFRTDLGRQYESFSVDGGESWAPAAPSRFTSPQSPLSMKREARSRALLAIWNPIPNYETRTIERHSWGRTPLVGALSKDDGATWTSHFAVEREEDGGGYCYTAIHFTADSVLLAYYAGRAEDGICNSRLRITKVPLTAIDQTRGDTR